MVQYQLVKWCRLCKARFLVGKSESRTVYCTNCQKRIKKADAKENK